MAQIDKQYLCYLLLGIGTLAPWNAFITAADYYALRYPVSLSIFQKQFHPSPHRQFEIEFPLHQFFPGLSCRPSADCLLLAR